MSTITKGLKRFSPALLAVIYFFIVCLSSASTSKAVGLGLVILAVALAILRFGKLRERVTPVLIALALLVAMDGVSTLYAVSGKFALLEFLKVLTGFCLTLVLLAVAPGKKEDTGRWIGTILTGYSALASLISIDLISTRYISGLVVAILENFSSDYTGLGGVEAGVRMTSIFINPNIFAGVVGLGTLLSLGLAMSAENRKERFFHLVCLYVSALGFVLAFSMGASAVIAVAFLVYLALEKSERRSELFILMAETLVLTVTAAFAVSLTSFTAWDGPRVVPILCVVVGSAALCLVDRFVGERLSKVFESHSKRVLVLIVAAVVLLVAVALLACNLTGSVQLEAGEYLRRAQYPEPGEYTLSVDADAPLTVTIESQNQRETMMHTSTVIYSGPADGAVFVVPDESLVVYFNFYAEQPVSLKSASFDGESIPLGYIMLPGFIANRLQGLFANQNAIQRFVFFSDGMKLFRRGPVVGLGLGAFENGIKSAQSFYYETKYAHNHYIQVLVETGIVGLALFVGLLVVAGISLWRTWRKKNFSPMVPALCAVLVFMAGHAAVEVVFSSYAYLPLAFGAFGLIGLFSKDVFTVSKKLQAAAVITTSVLLAVFGVLLGCNMRAFSSVQMEPTMDNLVSAASLDKFEWADYMVSYVLASIENDVDAATREQADEYAERLSKVDSNTLPLYLAQYFFCTGRVEMGLQMAEKYVSYTASDERAWQAIFSLLEAYEEDSSLYREGVVKIADMLDAWNMENLGGITLSEENEAFIGRIRNT